MTIQDIKDLQDAIFYLETKLEDSKRDNNINTMEKELKTKRILLQVLLSDEFASGNTSEGDLHIVNRAKTFKKISLLKLDEFDNDLYNDFVSSPYCTVDMTKFIEWMEANKLEYDLDDLDIYSITTKDKFMIVEV